MKNIFLIKDTLKENLTSIYKYGLESPLSLLVILKTSNSEILKPLQKIMTKFPKSTQWTIFTEDECKNALDVFPIEFLNMRSTGTLLEGSDFLKNLTIDDQNIRHEAEFIIRSTLLKCREAYLKKMPTKDIISNSLPTIQMVINQLSDKHRPAYFTKDIDTSDFDTYLKNLSALSTSINQLL